MLKFARTCTYDVSTCIPKAGLGSKLTLDEQTLVIEKRVNHATFLLVLHAWITT